MMDGWTVPVKTKTKYVVTYKERVTYFDQRDPDYGDRKKEFVSYTDLVEWYVGVDKSKCSDFVLEKHELLDIETHIKQNTIYR